MKTHTVHLLVSYCTFFFAYFPYSTNVEVRVALSQVEYPHIYPDPESRQLRAALVGVSVLQGYNRDLTKLW